MPEPLPFAFALRALEIHLTFATLVALAAWAVTSSPRVSATTKYWIWVATSINFVLPIGVLVDRFRPPDASWVLPLEDFGNEIARQGTVGLALGAAWVLGLLLMLGRLSLRVRAHRQAAAPPPRRGSAAREPWRARGVPVRFDADAGAPAVEGLMWPWISLPPGIQRLLTGPELDAVLLHELTHARRRDNLLRIVHEVGACVFWFHPLVWLTGSRLALYRELSCDEAVIRRARGQDLVSALAKLTNPAETLLLQAGASSFLADRVATLVSPRRTSPAASALQAAIFVAILLAGVLGSAFQSNLMHRAAMGEFCSRHAGR
jgi:beta-lactamase regulating signal transducer with metallopeptidase domain